MADGGQPYVRLVLSRATPEAGRWLERHWATLDATSFPPVYAGAGRRLGDERVHVNDDEAAALVRHGLVVPEGWPLRDVGRSALLQRTVQKLDPPEASRFVEQLYRTSDNAEREALLRTLVMLPDPAAHVETAIDACRSHVQSVFEALACENPYPARYFPDHNFNQLVLKAFFTGVRVERIAGLAERRTEELCRMANDYASERRAAGRPVPPDLGLVTELD